MGRSPCCAADNYCWGTDRGGIIYIKKEETKSPQRVGPNQELSGSVLRIQPTQAFRMLTPNSPKPLEVANKSVNPEYGIRNEGVTGNNIWRIMNASYQLLNQPNPDVPRPCWLCLDIRPPYYDAIGDLGETTRSNETDPPQCNWGRDVGITLTEVTGNGRCVGTVPGEKFHLCNITENATQLDKEKWLIPADNTRWVCSSLGVTPCLSLKLFNSSHNFCVQVVIIPRILYHSEEYMYTQHTVAEYHLKRREPITAVTLVTLMVLGAAGAGTGITSLVKQSQEFTSLRIAVDEDLARIEQSISALEKSVGSLSEVVLQNRRGLDLIFLQQGGLCAALREECCVYAAHTGVVRDTMAKLQEGLEKRKRENEARQNWYESWFNYSPWLTTLLSTIAGPLLLFILALTFGPCIFNRVIAIVKNRLEAAHLMLVRVRYESLEQEEDGAETLVLSKRILQKFNEQNMLEKEKGGIVIN